MVELGGGRVCWMFIVTDVLCPVRCCKLYATAQGFKYLSIHLAIFLSIDSIRNSFLGERPNRQKQDLGYCKNE